MVTRRSFLSCAAALAAAPSWVRAQSRPAISKAVLISMLPKELSYADRFRLAVDVGFHSMEAQTVDSMEEAQQIRDAADLAGLRIHSVMNMAHWAYPLSSPNSADVTASVKGVTASLNQAKLWGADTVLLVPAVVRPDTTYEEAWERSQQAIRQHVLPIAERLNVTIAIEEVWNKFLLTPRDFVQYIDEFEHPLVRAYFDVGNVVHYGLPEQWIRAIGDRLVKVHLKDYSRRAGFTNLGDAGEGGVDWPAVRAALREVGYTGTATVELDAGDRIYLEDVSQRVDRLLGLNA
jgi:L-ribulose-5-phosphate 3-epimerase